MNRTDRLLAIVLELQAKRWQRAEDLAQTFEISKRTIYRDLQALGQSGVPIVAVAGRGYSLVEGYFLPPLSFAVDEATMLLLGVDVMAGSFDAHYRAAAQSAGRKIAGVLGPAIRGPVETLRASIQFVTEGKRGHDAERATLRQLRGALLEHYAVRFAYHARFRRVPTGTPEGDAPPPERVVHPYQLFFVLGVWYLWGFDVRHGDLRTFRLDRIERLTVTDERFTPPAALPPRPTLEEEATVVVQVCFAPAVARWVREAPSYFTVAEEDTPAGLLVTLRVRHEEEIVQWLLGWGSNAAVLAPATLRRRIADEIRRMADRYPDLLP